LCVIVRGPDVVTEFSQGAREVLEIMNRIIQEFKEVVWRPTGSGSGLVREP